MNFFKKHRIIILLLLILFLAVFLRVWQIDSIPPGLYPDEAMNGNDALTTLKTGQFKIFYPENNGREGLFIWLIALSFKIIYSSVWTLRLVSAVFGILTVLGLYLMAKELFNKNIALLSSFFLSISFWHINFSRIGFRAILVPFLMCFSFYFLFRAFRKNTIFDYICAGIFFGLGFYTYIAFRMAVLILGIVILLKMIEYWRKNKPKEISWRWLWKKAYINRGWWKIDIFLIVILIVALPIGIHFLNNPQDFMGRAGGVSIFNAEQPIKELSVSIIKTLGMFNFVGDWNWRHNFAGSPMLAWPVGILFVLGLILAIKNLLKDWKHAFQALILLSWFFIMLLPAVLTYEGIPHALRVIGVIPIVCIFTALGLIWLFEQTAKINKKIAVLILIIFLLAPAIINFNKYFFQWAKNPNVLGAFRQDLTELSDYLNTLPNCMEKYAIINESGVPVPYPDGLPMPAQTIIFKSRIANSEIKYIIHDETIKSRLKPNQYCLSR